MDPMIGALANPGLPDIMKSYYGAGGGQDVSSYVKALDPQAGVIPGDGAGPPVMASPEDQKMLNADVPMSLDRANQIYDAYKRVGGGTDVSAYAKAADPYAGVAPNATQAQGMMPLLSDISKMISPEQLQRLLGAPMYGPDDMVRPSPGFANPSGGAY